MSFAQETQTSIWQIQNLIVIKVINFFGSSSNPK